MARPVARSGAVASAASLLIALVRLGLNGLADPVAWVLVVAAAGFGISAWLSKRHGQAGLALLPWVAAFAIFSMATIEGGLFSEALVWAPFVAMLSQVCFRSGARLATAGLLALPCGLLAIHLWGSHFPALPDNTPLWLRWFGLEGALIFGAVLAQAFQRWRLRSLEEVRAERERVQLIVDNLRTGIALTGPDGVVLVANKRLEKVLGIDGVSLVGGRLVEQLRELEQGRAESRVPGTESESAIDHIEVGNQIYELRCDSLDEGRQNLLLWSFHEVTKRIRSYTAALGRLQRDDLTGLFNRTHLETQLDNAVRAETGFALMFIDLDGFKPINDTLGHAEGDRILKGVAKRLLDTVRTGDVVCRIGGDEFCVIAYGVKEPVQAGVVADKIIEALRQPFAGEVTLGSSIGVSMARLAATRSVAQLISSADTAMYAAKRKGGNRWSLARPSLDMESLPPA